LQPALAPERIVARIPRRFRPVPSKENVMPTEIERSYVEQGYELPHGITWEMVAERRARWAIAAIFVPVAVASGCLGWGVPHIGGVPLRHP
jgi:hypothetical protein